MTTNESTAKTAAPAAEMVVIDRRDGFVAGRYTDGKRALEMAKLLGPNYIAVPAHHVA